MKNVETILAILPIITGILGFSINGYIKDKENKKLRKEIEEKDHRLRANEMYEKIRSKREIFEEALADLICLDLDTSISEKRRTLMKVNQKYNALYNEVEDYCTKVLDGAINSDNYIKQIVLPVFCDMAELQVSSFTDLNKYAKKFELDPLKKPDYKSFDNYDKFLIKYNDGENSHFWRKIKNARRDADFE